MSVTSKLKIIGKNPKVGDIISKFIVYRWDVLDNDENHVIIRVTMPNRAGLNELKRRLGGKFRRNVRVIELGGGREEDKLSDEDE